MAKESESCERQQQNKPPAFAAEHLAALLENTQDLIWSVDLKYRLVTFNKALSDAFARGYGTKIAVGMTPRDLLTLEKAAVFPLHYEKALHEGPCSAEYCLADGRYLLMTFNPIVQDGRKVGVSVIGKDVTRQKSAEVALQITAEQYRGIFEFAPEAMFRVTEEGKTLAINPAGAKLLGYDSPGEAIAALNDWGRQVWLDPAERSAYLGVLEQKGEARSGPCQFRRKDGTRFWGVMTQRKICGPDGKTLYHQGFLEDITEHKVAVDALQEAEQKFREIFEDAPEGIFQTTKEGRSLTLNPAGAKLLGFSSSANAVVSITDSAHDVWLDPQDRARYTQLLEEQGEIRDFSCQLKRSDGTPIWVSLSARKVCGQDGQTLYYQGFIEDITEKKELEADLAAKVRELQVLREMDSALLHSKTEEELLTEYCRIVVKVGGYRMAWVGFAEEGPEKRVIPVAHYGHEDGYLEIVNVTWADTERGQGPTGLCIRTGEIAVARDFAADPMVAPWREEALKRGYMSSIAIPFRHFEGEMARLTAYGVRVSRWSDSERRMMEQVASALGYGITTLRTAVAKAQHQKDLRVSLEQTIEVIAETVEQRDPYTAGHQRRVADLCVAIARKLGLSSERTEGLRLAASIHDLGKIGIPAEVLAKPDRLTENQFNLIKEHAQLGYEIVKNVQFPWPIAQMIYQHHENLDGSGYPRGLKGDEIFLESRILAVADVVEAMSSHRPYRPSKGIDAALDEVLSNSGALYDSAVVEACVNLFRHEGYKLPPP
jgi:PAS domain S-box-containing protein/putative nucleotidyltransferase with HDIG domain